MSYLSLWDLVLTPLYLLVIISLAKRYRDKRYGPGNPLRKYYMQGLYLKLGGAIFIALIFQFLYGGGDTFNFFYHAQVINSSLDSSLSTWFKLITHANPNTSPEIYPYISQMFWYDDSSSYAISVITAVLGLVNGTTYLPIALLFATISYSGIWAMYRTFVFIYPKYHKALALAFLFVPSTFVWGSAIFKDTICMLALGWMTYTTFRIFINRDFSVKNIGLLVMSFYLLAVIKLYILLAFLPALSIWLLLTYSRRISSAGVRWIVNILFVAAAVGGFLFITNQFAADLNKYSLDKIAKTAQTTQGWINYVSEAQEGSGYNIGELDGSIGSMIAQFPQAIVVTLYRPFLWEVKKPIMLLSALESLAFLYLTLNVFFTKGGWSRFRRIFADPNLLFFFIYSIIFAFAVGVSTGNFGTLSRYKIPCMPFFSAILLMFYFEKRAANKKQGIHAQQSKRSIRRFA